MLKCYECGKKLDLESSTTWYDSKNRVYKLCPKCHKKEIKKQKKEYEVWNEIGFDTLNARG